MNMILTILPPPHTPALTSLNTWPLTSRIHPFVPTWDVGSCHLSGWDPQCGLWVWHILQTAYNSLNYWNLDHYVPCTMKSLDTYFVSDWDSPCVRFDLVFWLGYAQSFTCGVTPMAVVPECNLPKPPGGTHFVHLLIHSLIRSFIHSFLLYLHRICSLSWHLLRAEVTKLKDTIFVLEDFTNY